MTWELSFLPEAQDDLRSLDGSQRIRVVKAIAKVQENPLPASEGGYGKPLGNTRISQLSGLMKVKLKSMEKKLEKILISRKAWEPLLKHRDFYHISLV